MHEFKVRFYKKDDGTEPAKDFLDTLDAKMFAKMVRSIEIVRIEGVSAREPYSKYLNDGIFEVRAKVGSDISRVLYFFFINKQIILTHGFTKKTQKTPPSEINKAKKYRADFTKREKKNDWLW